MDCGPPGGLYLAAGHTPDANPLITAGGQTFAVRAEGHVHHLLHVGVLASEHLMPRRRIPHLDQTRIRDDGGQEFAVRAESRMFLARVREPVNRHDGLARGQVPDPDRTR